MSIDTVSDVLSRVSAIEQQVQQLQSGALLDAQLGVSGGSSSSSTSSAGGTSDAAFASQLAQAQGSDPTTASASTDAADGSASADSAVASANGASFGSLADSALGASGVTGGAAVTGGTGVTLPASASSMLTSGQQQFASTLSADTGLNPGVISSWLLAEESGGAAESRQTDSNNDWLNIGYTDSGSYGANDSVWSDPVSAANATAQWMQGQSSIDGYGTASAGIQSILSSVGQPPAAQIQAIQGSGWASSGYPSLGELYGRIASA